MRMNVRPGQSSGTNYTNATYAGQYRIRDFRRGKPPISLTLTDAAFMLLMRIKSARREKRVAIRTDAFAFTLTAKGRAQ